MKRLVAAIRLDARLQLRYGLYAVTAVVVAVWAIALWFLAEALRPLSGLLVPVFVSGNLLMTTFYFVAALVLFEKGEGSLAAIATTPLSDAEYLLSKVLSLTALALVESLVIVAVVSGTEARWGLLLPASALLAAVYTMLGFVAIVRHDSINEFLLPSVGYVFAFVLPLVGHFGFVDSLFFLPHPVEMALVLMRGAYAPEPLWKITLALFGLVAWFAATFLWARQRFDRFVVRTAGG
jgi:fluoroquinolone transport system permease protein